MTAEDSITLGIKPCRNHFSLICNFPIKNLQSAHRSIIAKILLSRLWTALKSLTFSILSLQVYRSYVLLLEFNKFVNISILYRRNRSLNFFFKKGIGEGNTCIVQQNNSVLCVSVPTKGKSIITRHNIH